MSNTRNRRIEGIPVRRRKGPPLQKLSRCENLAPRVQNNGISVKTGNNPYS